MISFIASSERIIYGETLKVKLNIQGKLNIKTHKGTYFNIIIKKNGSLLNTVTLYPLRFNGSELEWEINEYSYGSEGTFIIDCIFQGSLKVLTTTTFIVEPCNLVNNANINNNLTSLEQAKRLKNSQIKTQEVPIDYTVGCLIQKPGMKIDTINDKIKKQSNDIHELVLSSKVQKAFRNC